MTHHTPTDWKPLIKIGIGIFALALVGSAAIFFSAETPETIAIKYADPYNWYVTGTNPSAEVDVFYLYSDIDISHIKPRATNADVSVYEVRNSVHDKIMQMEEPAIRGMNAYIPYYRQTTAYAKVSPVPLAEATAKTLAYADVKAAFHQYISTWNDGKPYILAGSGQGSEYIADMLIEWFDSKPAYREHLQAVYLDGVLQSDEEMRTLLGRVLLKKE